MRYCNIIYIPVAVGMLFVSGSPVMAKSADDLYREGKFAEADKAYMQGDMDNPKDPRYRYDRGCAAYRNKDYQGAAASFSSVLKRAKDGDILFRSAYNLGNTAFVQNDFAAAAEYYKQAIIYDPSNADVRYNLELSLKKMEEAKNNPDKAKKDNKGDGKDGSKTGDQKSGDKGDNNKDKNDKSGKDKDRDGDNFRDKDKKEKQDLSGKLDSAEDMGEKKKPELTPAEMMERKKAEALLNNVKEDRARVLQMRQKGKRQAGSGKNW